MTSALSLQLADRWPHVALQDTAAPSHHRRDRTEPEGKRWVRRRENANFAHNPHIAHPTSVDLALPLQVPLSTFPHPLPQHLSRTLLPSARPPPSLPSTSAAGLFSLSLRGIRRHLRARPFSAPLVNAIETHLATWLQGGTYLNPDHAKGHLCFPGDPVGDRDDIREVAREAGRLVWAVKPASTLENRDGGFERYVVHCVARWYGVVSFSKESEGCRLTYLLRPNITRPDPRVHASSGTLDTPPPTDASDFHVSDASLSDYATTDPSDVDSAAGDPPISTRSLSDIRESRPSSPPAWSVVGGPDFAVDSEDDTDDRGFAASLESLSLAAAHADCGDGFTAPLAADTTLAPPRLQNGTQVGRGEWLDHGEDQTPSRARADRHRLRILYPRSASSPSPARRSPHRLPASRKQGARWRAVKNNNKTLAGAVGTNKGSFYDYLFS